MLQVGFKNIREECWCKKRIDIIDTRQADSQKRSEKIQNTSGSPSFLSA